MLVTVQFRGEAREVKVDQFDVDESVNAFVCEWHFVGVTPEEHDSLGITDAEEDNVIEQIDARYREAE